MSDIWNEFEKIAVEQGLISVGKEDREDRKQEDPSEMPARYDSLSDDAIGLLYGITPENIYDKGKEHKTLFDVAHPDTAIAGRAYDAMNAVWENLYERQGMMAYIALKMPNGQLTQRRYVAAKQDLVKALVSSAFTLDHQEEGELMSLADSCAERLDKRSEEVQLGFYKKAFWPAAAAIAAVLGGIYYIGWGAQTAQNVYANSKQVMESLQDPDISGKPYADGIRADIENLMERAQAAFEQKDQLAHVQSVDAAATALQSAEHKAQIEKVSQNINEYIKQLRKVERAIPDWVSKIQVGEYTTEESSDWWAKLREIGGLVHQSPAEKLMERLAGKANWIASGRSGGLLEAIEKDIAMMNQAVNGAKREVQDKAPEFLGGEQPTTPAEKPIAQAPAGLPTPTPAPAPTPPAGAARTRPEPEAAPEW
jgi:hypothetical protein